jgi:hypothetical protein
MDMNDGVEGTVGDGAVVGDAIVVAMLDTTSL